MKKLLVLLFSIMISFNSFAGSLDGKGLKCVHEYMNSIKFIWFEKNLYYFPDIEGYEIVWFEGYRYIEDGTSYIKLYVPPYSSLGWWAHKRIDRTTLRMKSLNSYYQCYVLNSKQQIIDALNKKIDAAKSANKI